MFNGLKDKASQCFNTIAGKASSAVERFLEFIDELDPIEMPTPMFDREVLAERLDARAEDEAARLQEASRRSRLRRREPFGLRRGGNTSATRREGNIIQFPIQSQEQSPREQE